KSDFIGDKNGQNTPLKAVGFTSLPNDPFSTYLLGAQVIGVGGATALPTGHVASIVHTEQTYGLMVHMAQSLGVNCTYCHNTRNFKAWDGAPPQRTTAWHGIRMARELNNDYLVPLSSTFPPSRLGPTGDVAKVSCATCHQGVYKPLYGAPMAEKYPALQRAASPASVAAADAPVATQ
ncbi:MAG: photosynthetic reaction center cytochrome PufC, partial [Rubrivivax sp.]|nr:photosynthetic reaction center cytochrome PufC [Rubrivivax sp.]